MFKKNKNDQNLSYISKLIELEGILSTNGELRVDCKIKGEIYCEKIDVGKESDIDGNIYSNELTIDGSFKGNMLTKNQLSILDNTKIKGNIQTSSLTVDQGALIDGIIDIIDPNNNLEKEKPQIKDATVPIKNKINKNNQ